MKIIRQIVVSSEAPSTEVLWINKGEARVYNNGTWQLISAQEDIEIPTWETLEGKPDLATVATSGDYKDLKNTPTQYTLPIATTSKIGGVKMGNKVADLTAEATLEQVIQEYNSLLEVLRTAGLISK